MNTLIKKLYHIAAKEKRYIIGLMSGTSLDGLDIALCRCSGSGMETKIELDAFETINYDSNFKTEVKSIFSKRNIDLEKVCLLNGWVAEQHAVMILKCLIKWGKKPADIDLIASHGQTIYHAPKFLHQQPGFGNATLQIGDGDHLAVRTGIITLSDFRQKHVAAGGESAPLAVYGDYLIFSSSSENRIMLNIGGIANFTYLPETLDSKAVFSTDTGTGNTLMDAYIQKHYPGKYYDDRSAVASKGTVHKELLKALMNDTFFSGRFPKTIGPELFNLEYLQKAIQATPGSETLSQEDVMATLNTFSADTIVNALKITMGSRNDFAIYVSGGGMYNPLLLQNIQRQLPGITFRDTSYLNIHPDAKEAVLFALLANECVAGGKVGPGNMKQGIPSVSMGKISLPG